MALFSIAIGLLLCTYGLIGIVFTLLFTNSINGFGAIVFMFPLFLGLFLVIPITLIQVVSSVATEVSLKPKEKYIVVAGVFVTLSALLVFLNILFS